jgi:hypothetical protein
MIAVGLFTEENRGLGITKGNSGLLRGRVQLELIRPKTNFNNVCHSRWWSLFAGDPTLCLHMHHDLVSIQHIFPSVGKLNGLQLLDSTLQLSLFKSIF